MFLLFFFVCLFFGFFWGVFLHLRECEGYVLTYLFNCTLSNVINNQCLSCLSEQTWQTLWLTKKNDPLLSKFHILLKLILKETLNIFHTFSYTVASANLT